MATPTSGLKPAAVAALALNGVFLAFHPAWAHALPDILQSFGIGLVLFVAPALAFLGVLRRRDDAPGATLPGAGLISLGVLLAVLIVFRVIGTAPAAVPVWNGMWAGANLLLVAAAMRGVVGPGTLPRARGAALLALALFAGAYALYFVSARDIVPEQYDHDLEVQATGHGLLTRFEPFLLTDRGTIYYFAHPPLLHLYAGTSVLFFGGADHLAAYDDASRRALASAEGRPFTPPAHTFIRVRPAGEPPRYPRFDVLGVEDTSYVIDPPLDDGSTRLSIEEGELATIYAAYAANPHAIETRSPNIFLAAVTVALIGYWVAVAAGSLWAGVLPAVAYATSPEVLVRSSYGGYFAIGSLLLVLMLIVVANEAGRPADARRRSGFAAGALAAWADHKLVLFPIALVLYELVASREPWLQRVKRALSFPIVAGFAAATALYWVYGSLVNARVFWIDHVRTHLFDRMLHVNPLGYSNYPGVVALWAEFSAHTGYLLLPLATLALLHAASSRDETATLARPVASTWLTYALLTAAVFSWADWRMTKHLMLLVPVLFVAPALWAGTRRGRWLLVSVAFGMLIAWNIATVAGIASDFDSFAISPAW